MKRFLSILLLVSLSFGGGLEGLREFFERGGVVVDRLDHRVILDLGRDRVSVGEVFAVVREGKELVHPVTGKVIGKIEGEIGKVKVSEVEDRYSVAQILEDKGIRRGDKVKLLYGKVCFEGSDEGFFKVSSVVRGLVKGGDCRYVVREFEGGFGVELDGRAVAFFEKPRPVVVQPAREPEEFRIDAKFVVTFPSLPLSADFCRLFGSEKDYLVVLFKDSLKFYEVLQKEVTEYASMNLPPGYPVSVQCASLGGNGDLILLNLVSGVEMSSAIVKIVGGVPVVLKENIPYYMAVLDKERPAETFVGQKFDGRNLWGEVRKLRFEGDSIVEGEVFKVPPGFRLDSAVMFKDKFIFTDRDGYLRIYRGDELLYSEESFSGSYTTARLPEVYEGESKYVFNPRHFTFKVGRREYAGAVRNVTSPVYRFLNVTKFSEGELYVVTETKKGLVELKKVRGKKFEEAVQAVIKDSEGRLYVLTGRMGTLPLQERGDLFRVEIAPF